MEIDYSERSENVKQKEAKQLYIVLNIITQFFLEVAVGMVIGYFLGKYLDLWILKDKSLFVYILMILGMFGALANLVKRALRLSGGETNGKKDERH